MTESCEMLQKGEKIMIGSERSKQVCLQRIEFCFMSILLQSHKLCPLQ